MPSIQPIPGHDRPKTLLALDGGGVKGISSLMILKAIMTEVAKIEDGLTDTTTQLKQEATVSSIAIPSQPSPERKPSAYFNLTGGTSTGGIIAVMLGRLDMSCSEAISEYTALSKEIFAVRIGPINVSQIPLLNKLDPAILGIKTLFGSQFSSKYIKQGISRVLQNKTYNPKGGVNLVDDSQFLPYNAPGKMLMCATMANRGKAILFRDYTPPADSIPESGKQKHNDDSAPPAFPYVNLFGKDPTKAVLLPFQYNQVTIEEAVLATSAAPTYLPPAKIQHITFWDGGCLNNNPIDQVWAARYDLVQKPDMEPYVSTVVSLGCSFADEAPEPKFGIIARLTGILGRSLSFMTNTEAKHMDFKRNIYRRNLRQPKSQQTAYFRFNTPTGKTTIGLADYKKMDSLVKMTENYLNEEKTQIKIRACAQLLVDSNRQS